MQHNSAIFDCIYLRDTEVLFLKPTITVSQEGISYESLFLMNVHGQSQIPSFATKYMQIFKHTTEKALNIVKNHNVSNHRFFMYVQVNGNLILPYVILHSDISNTGACSSQFQLCSCMFICYSQVIRTNKISEYNLCKINQKGFGQNDWAQCKLFEK